VLALAKDYSHILFPATASGKNIAPRVAAKLDVAQISDITKVDSADTFERPIYAGNAIATVQSADATKVITVRTTGFEPKPEGVEALRSAVRAAESEGIHEVQAGELENRNDDDAIAEFNAIYQRWHQGEVDVPMPGGENARDVLDRYLPVITDLRLRYLDNEDWTSDIVVVSHGAAIRLTAATLAGVDSSFVLDHHLANAESVVLAPITDGRWSCLRWGAKTPPFYPEPDVHPVEDALESPDPMG